MRTKVSSKSQVSIPAAIRKEFDIKPNIQLEWISEGGLITVIPVTDNPVTAFRGRGKGLYPSSKLVLDRQKERKEENDRGGA
ncbi:MAG: AbrB/MazE/SpoVT family DNA-binding domain-containing protein [Deltaproteobacteria bacterium]|nr:AbrB/MazE/SpoVT family DNA-binding domain-containing protein [Deltaproteobacteria bacterium]